MQYTGGKLKLRLSGLQYCAQSICVFFCRGTDFHGETIFFYPTPRSYFVNQHRFRKQLRQQSKLVDAGKPYIKEKLSTVDNLVFFSEE